MKNRRNKLSQFILSKGLFFFLVALLLFFSFSLLREIKNKKSIQDEIKSLQQELVNIDQQNSELQNLIDYLKTDEYAELEAKKKLGMKKTGEKVILVTEADLLEAKPVDDSADHISNGKIWWNYFFN